MPLVVQEFRVYGKMPIFNETKKTIIPSFVSEQGRGRECPMGDILKAVSFLAMFL